MNETKKMSLSRAWDDIRRRNQLTRVRDLRGRFESGQAEAETMLLSTGAQKGAICAPASPISKRSLIPSSIQTKRELFVTGSFPLDRINQAITERRDGQIIGNLTVLQDRA